MQDPESIVRAFIADYFQWNTRALELCALDPSMEAMGKADSEYSEFLSRYCPPGLRRQNIAFGTPADHDPTTERIRESTRTTGRAIVKTTNTEYSGFEADYEYSFAFANGRWFLEALDYVNEEGRYPCL